MVTVAPRLVWIPHPSLMVAFVGLDGDVQSLSETLQVEIHGKLNRALGLQLSSSSSLPPPPPSSSSTTTTDVGREKEASVLRRISPLALASLTSHVLYQNRGKFYVEPLIAGLRLMRRKTTRGGGSGSTHGDDDDEGEHLVPFLCGMDSIGAQSLSDSFVCSGAASSSLYGTAEALWRPNLEPDELVEACGKAFQSALERDCLSGYGVLVYLITKDGIVEHDLASRND